MTRASIFFVFVLFFSCQKDQSVTLNETIDYPGVDSRLWPYFERFESEGLERGHDISLTSIGIEGVIQSIDEEHIAGTCQFNRFQPRLITIDSEFWQRSSELFREFIVFHELGHCALLRDHDESANGRGVCLSIMRSGTGDCLDNYRSSTREVYLNELFSKSNEL